MVTKKEYKQWWHEALDEAQEADDFHEDLDISYWQALQAHRKATKRYDALYEEFQLLIHESLFTKEETTKYAVTMKDGKVIDVKEL